MSIFSDVDEWGNNPRRGLTKDMKETIGTSLYLMYLVDEVGVK